MQKGLGCALVMMAILCSMFALSGYAYATAVQGWQIEDGGGHCSESNGFIRLWTDGGWIVLYREYVPATDFRASLEVKASRLQGFALMLRGSLPFAGSIDGVNLEFSARSGLAFHFASNIGSGWSSFIAGQEDVWYRMALSVYSSPYAIAAEVYNESGTLLGSVTTSDMKNFAFGDIRYVGFGVLESGGDFTVQNASISPELELPTTRELPLGIIVLGAGLVLIAIAVGIYLKVLRRSRTKGETPLVRTISFDLCRLRQFFSYSRRLGF